MTDNEIKIFIDDNIDIINQCIVDADFCISLKYQKRKDSYKKYTNVSIIDVTFANYNLFYTPAYGDDIYFRIFFSYGNESDSTKSYEYVPMNTIILKDRLLKIKKIKNNINDRQRDKYFYIK